MKSKFDEVGVSEHISSAVKTASDTAGTIGSKLYVTGTHIAETGTSKFGEL